MTKKINRRIINTHAEDDRMIIDNLTKGEFDMKKVIRLIALGLVLVMGLGMLASCGKTLSGKYSADVLGTGTALTFDGKNVKIAITVTLLGEVASVDATYEIKDDKISFDIADDEDVSNELAKQVLKAFEAPMAFEDGGDYIKINGVKYNKADK